jgi:pSer/pThr/pTyr-binding forkhead associated (FHA) protein
VLNDPSVSRHHASLRTTDSQCFVVDAGSRFGTFINEERIQGETLFPPGATLKVGEVAFSLEQLVREQEQLQDRTLAAEKNVDLLSKKREMEELTRAQEQLAQRTEETARQLRRDGQDAAARELERAARDMNRARQCKYEVECHLLRVERS